MGPCKVEIGGGKFKHSKDLDRNPKGREAFPRGPEMELAHIECQGTLEGMSGSVCL